MPTHKVLKSVAHNMAHSFTSAMNYRDNDYVMGHLLLAARSSGKSVLHVDLLKSTAEPLELIPPPVIDSVMGYCTQFPALLQRSGSDQSLISAAQMTVTYDLNKTRPFAADPRLIESPFLCEVQIIDDKGKTHSGQVSGWWCPETAFASNPSIWARLQAWFLRP